MENPHLSWVSYHQNGWIFNGDLLVYRSVFRWVFDQVSSEHEKILSLVFARPESHRSGRSGRFSGRHVWNSLLIQWMRSGPHSRNWPKAPRTIVGAGPGQKTLVSQRTWHQQSPPRNPWDVFLAGADQSMGEAVWSKCWWFCLFALFQEISNRTYWIDLFNFWWTNRKSLSGKGVSQLIYLTNLTKDGLICYRLRAEKV